MIYINQRISMIGMKVIHKSNDEKRTNDELMINNNIIIVPFSLPFNYAAMHKKSFGGSKPLSTSLCVYILKEREREMKKQEQFIYKSFLQHFK